jgi:hypothetical protein
MLPAGARTLLGRVWVLRGKFSTSPLATETMPALYVHGAEQDAGGVKVVVSVDNVSEYSAPAVVQSTVEQKEMVTLIQGSKEWK